MATEIMPRDVRSLALALHTDLTNIETYASNRVLAAELVLTAEAKIAIITAQLLTARQALGMRGCATIVDMSNARG